jgi:hypothetical protein
LTPSSYEEVSAADAVPGVARMLQIEHGHPDDGAAVVKDQL